MAFRSLRSGVVGGVAVVAAMVVVGGAVAWAHGLGGHGSRGTSTNPERVCRQLAAGDTSTGVLATLTTAQLAQLKSDCATLTAAEATQQTADKAAEKALRAALKDARQAFKTACPQIGSTGASGATGATGATGASGRTPPSAACIAARNAERKAERAAEKGYLQALKTAAVPVTAAANTVAADLTADQQANGSTGATGASGAHHHRHGLGATGATGATATGGLGRRGNGPGGYPPPGRHHR